MYGSYYGLGLGFGDPYFRWNSYFMWNSFYNPYFYNPYYGGGAIIVKGATYNNKRILSSACFQRSELQEWSCHQS